MLGPLRTVRTQIPHANLGWKKQALLAGVHDFERSQRRTHMSMYVVGRAPTSERGKHFGNSIHWWHPLAAFCQHVAPEIASGCKDWHTNDGDGLDADAARALADALR